MSQIMHLDATGLACPQPVLRTKAILDAGHKGSLTIGLDNEASAINVATFLQGMGFKTQTYQQANQWLVLGHGGDAANILVWYGQGGWQTVTDDEGEARKLEDDPIIDLISPVSVGNPSGPPPIIAASVPSNSSSAAIVCPVQDTSDNVAVLVGSEFMGAGDDGLGAKLALNFFDTLAALGQPPRLIAFYNTGVRLTTRDSSIVEALRDLVSQGSTVISCGVCLEYFQIREHLKVGRIGNMYEIINAQRNADRVVRL